MSELSEHERGSASLLGLVHLVEQEDGRQAAVQLLAERLHERPSVRGVRHLLDLSFPPAEDRESVGLVRDILDKLLQREPTYRCGRCGFRPRALYWHCPSCRSWGTVKPIHGLVGD